MVAKELAKILLENPDFRVKGRFIDYFSGYEFPKEHRVGVYGIDNIDYKNKIIVLDLD